MTVSKPPKAAKPTAKRINDYVNLGDLSRSAAGTSQGRLGAMTCGRIGRPGDTHGLTRLRLGRGFVVIVFPLPAAKQLIATGGLEPPPLALPMIQYYWDNMLTPAP